MLCRACGQTVGGATPEEIDNVCRGRPERHSLGCDDLQVFERFYTICMDDRSDVGEGDTEARGGTRRGREAIGSLSIYSFPLA